MVPVVTALSLLALAQASTPMPPPMAARTHHVEVARDLPFPAEQVWEAVALDYGRIAESHPLIVSSDYRHGSLQGELGAERTCWFNEKGSRLLHEQIVSWDAEAMTFQNRVLEADGFPLDPDNTLATYTVEPLSDGSSRVSIVMDYRTAPAMMGGLMKGAFGSLLDDYFVALEHHLATGEAVTRDNFKAIAKAYR